MRIFAHPPRRLRDSDQRQHFNGARLGRFLVEPLVQSQRLADLAADGQDRIEARHRLLKHHRNVVAADRAHFAVGKQQQIPAAFLSVTVLAVNLLGDGLRDALDPRMAKGL